MRLWRLFAILVVVGGLLLAAVLLGPYDVTARITNETPKPLHGLVVRFAVGPSADVPDIPPGGTAVVHMPDPGALGENSLYLVDGTRGRNYDLISYLDTGLRGLVDVRLTELRNGKQLVGVVRNHTSWFPSGQWDAIR